MAFWYFKVFIFHKLHADPNFLRLWVPLVIILGTNISNCTACWVIKVLCTMWPYDKRHSFWLQDFLIPFPFWVRRPILLHRTQETSFHLMPTSLLAFHSSVELLSRSWFSCPVKCQRPTWMTREFYRTPIRMERGVEVPAGKRVTVGDL